MKSEFIIEVNESDFEYQVLAFSQQTPVLVDFWAQWCVPCKMLGPMLEKLAEEAGGSFRLAKVNVDQNPNLARQFRVVSIPAVKIFRDGAVVAEFTGALPEPRIRDILRSVIPNELDLKLEKADSLFALGEIYTAEQTYREVLESMPENSKALLGLSRCLLLSGEAEEAAELLANFPPSREYAKAEILLPLAQALVRFVRAESDELPDNPLDAAYARALRLALRGNIEASMDGLLDILRQDKRYRGGEARQVMLGLLELFPGDDPRAQEYRNELASVLF